MAKGASIKFLKYEETVPKILSLLKLQNEVKKYDKIVLKPWLSLHEGEATPSVFVEQVLKFVLNNKNPVAEVFIAEGSDGVKTSELFEKFGYNKLAEKYSVGLVDLNKAETEVADSSDFLRFNEINYPKILLEGFVISLPRLRKHGEFDLLGSLSNMLGAYPSNYYKGFFSKTKNKIRKWSIDYSIHDIVKCKLPDFAVVDASEKGLILAGLPEEMDRQGAKILGEEWKDVGYLKLLEESRLQKEREEEKV